MVVQLIKWRWGTEEERLHWRLSLYFLCRSPQRLCRDCAVTAAARWLVKEESVSEKFRGDIISPSGVLPFVLSTVQHFIQHFWPRLCYFWGVLLPGCSTLFRVLIDPKHWNDTSSSGYVFQISTNWDVERSVWAGPEHRRSLFYFGPSTQYFMGRSSCWPKTTPGQRNRLTLLAAESMTCFSSSS